MPGALCYREIVPGCSGSKRALTFRSNETLRDRRCKVPPHTRDGGPASVAAWPIREDGDRLADPALVTCAVTPPCLSSSHVVT
jgi:hypothetical protein